MDNSDDFGAILKRLDELDAREYSPKFIIHAASIKNMATTQDHKIDSNESDFDDSEEDLASLLKDDEDDDIFAKKVFGISPTKAPIKDEKSKIQLKTSPQKSLQSPMKKTSKIVDSKSTPKDILDDDILDDFLESGSGKSKFDLKISTPEKRKSSAKQKNRETEETDSFGDLDLSEFSPSKNFPDESTEKIEKTIDKNSDVLDDLKTTKTHNKTSGDRRGSFFDEFLQKLSPKHENKKPAVDDGIPEKPEIEAAVSEEDILGAYIPTGPKKNARVTVDHANSPKRRSSLMKQVSFKDPSANDLETDTFDSNFLNSPERESSLKQTLSDSKNIKNTAQTKRSEKLGSDNSDEIDWLNYFKSSPKKNAKPQESKQNNEFKGKRDLTNESKSKPAIRRQNSADWLGLSESKSSDNEESHNNIKTAISPKKETRPKTVSAPIVRPRHQENNKFLGEWNDESFEMPKTIGKTPTTDLSEILKEIDTKLPEKKTKSAVPFTEDDSENNSSSMLNMVLGKVPQNAQTVNDIQETTKLKSPVKMTLHSSLSNDTFSVPQVRNPQQNFEQTVALQSLQSMLNESILERNKLLKENEAIKTALEEKIRTTEEFYKSEKKILEDSMKTLESSLKKEFEMKINLLEERLKLITEEKERQTGVFDEKMKSVLKDHQLEVQRLKDLQSQSINIMKQDHEDALARLKKLKDQEIEAILSAQSHSKSLQYLSDQLEARANELASLQDKIEQRNQTTLNERQSFLDAKEKELKALQLRLQKQLEDGEEERSRLQQLILRLEGRLQKMTMEDEENHWETQQLKAKLTVQKKYMDEEQKLNQFQLEKEKEKLKISQDSLLQEQKTVLLQLAQERQQLTQEKNEMQSLATRIKEEESKLRLRKLKEDGAIEAEKQSLLEEKNKLYFEKEKIKQEMYQLERERDSLMREKQHLRKEKEDLQELEMNLKRKSFEIEDMTAAASVERERGRREYAEAMAMKKEQQLKFQQYTQQMQMLMEKERHILSEKEKLIAEKEEFEQNKSSVLCTKCKFSPENPVQVSSPILNWPVYPLQNMNGITNQVQHSMTDPSLVIWKITAEKDKEFLKQELAFLMSLKESKRKNSK